MTVGGEKMAMIIEHDTVTVRRTFALVFTGCYRVVANESGRGLIPQFNGIPLPNVAVARCDVFVHCNLLLDDVHLVH